MKGFLTEGDGKYILDLKNKRLLGGEFGEGAKYKTAIIKLHEEAVFQLENGEKVSTSKVIGFI